MSRIAKLIQHSEHVKRGFKERKLSEPIELWESKREQRNKTQREYYARNKDKVIAHQKRYRAQKSIDKKLSKPFAPFVPSRSNNYHRSPRQERDEVEHAKIRYLNGARSGTFKFFYYIVNVDTGQFVRSASGICAPEYCDKVEDALWYGARRHVDADSKASRLSRVIPHDVVQLIVFDEPYTSRRKP
jgi:hypothetical protein